MVISAFGIDHGSISKVYYGQSGSEEGRAGSMRGNQNGKGKKHPLKYECDHCGKKYTLNGDNTVRHHWIGSGFNQKHCPGACKVPKAMRLF